MRPKRLLKKTLTNTPKIGRYIKRKDELEKSTQTFYEQTMNLRKTIEALEVRNKQWEDEVRAMRGEAQSLEIMWPVKKQDIIQASLVKKPSSKKRKKVQPPYTITWVVPVVGKVSGGHADIFRTINYLESRGHTCRIYFYDALQTSSLDEIKKNLKNYPPLKAKLFYNVNQIEDSDALFATNWYTAYPVHNHKGRAKKFYFVQDFEPYFDPVGSYSTLAENTYKFGLHGITLGNWLSKKLSREYGMICEPVDLGVDTDDYKLQNTKKRNKILFYARPVTPRRGFELGILALEEFHKQHPEYEINFLGWDISPYNIPFPYKNNGILSTKELNKLYNECTAGLVLSFTNMSLLPLEMIAAGCVPVLNRAEHTEIAKYKKYLKYADPTPSSLAQALSDVIRYPHSAKNAKQMTAYAQNFQWSHLYGKIEEILDRELS